MSPKEIAIVVEQPGSVINYIQSPNRFLGIPLNPIYISDPSIVVLPNGDYVASHALFGSGSGSSSSGTTSVFRSSDKGQTWTHLVTLTGILRASLFVHNGDLYLLGAQSEQLSSVIRKSTDNGNTWTTPVDAQTGLFSLAGMGTPNNPITYGGRIWTAQGGVRVLSAPATVNLLLESSWTRSNAASNAGHPFGEAWDTWTEAQVVASPQTGVYILPKIKNQMNTATIRILSATTVSFNAAASNAFPSLPGGEKKFGASYDPVSGKFYIVSNPVLPVHADSGVAHDLIRTTSAIISSKDLMYWDVEKIFIFTPNIDNGTFGEGFQYFNFDFDDDDMVIASRTAFDVGGGQRKPPRGHDSNLLTFHRIEDFRNASPEHFLILDGNQVLRYETTHHDPAPLGKFTLGTIFAGTAINNPNGLGQCPAGDVYIREQGGRILRFDALGNFIETVVTAPVTFQTAPLSISQPPYGQRAWIGTGSGNWYNLNGWFYWGRPDTNYEVTNLGSAITADSTLTIDNVFINTYTMKGLRFRSAHSYTLSGSGKIILAADEGPGVLDVQQGIHHINIPMTLASDTHVNVRDAAALHVQGRLDLNGKSLTLDGAGQFLLSGQFDMKFGQLRLNEQTSLAFSNTFSGLLRGILTFEPSSRIKLKLGESFRLFEGAEYLNGTFMRLNFPQLADGLVWDTSMLYSHGTVMIVPGMDFIDLNNFACLASWWLADYCTQQTGCNYILMLTDFSNNCR